MGTAVCGFKKIVYIFEKQDGDLDAHFLTTPLFAQRGFGVDQILWAWEESCQDWFRGRETQRQLKRRNLRDKQTQESV